ncbi:hypothetical protein [Actinokineospora globicatena]|uniref:Integral membrane protein n=1 Tax=Actinokineospora globicatena TaxID=103729 RepID=A0A9W6QN30_9PSEU|nr:hypothetical protein [Actinokineospora globicatena]MCP2305897.1 hypothetical protein [Actinokineospora globicatena]GLW80234.1 hypothetical protein Aglo01_47150 [Actinokineospora globicatena]GLW87063.1 hypothetical protein Aglo02_47020 [Actinokineospora globicatena]GLW93428.1 hypothetical protein Aglo03_42440 [Actinokineospora globicatena]
MSDLAITVLLCVAVSIIYAIAALIQARLGHLSVRELTKVPVWWVAQALNVAGAALHVVSLGFGPLSLIQPLGVLTLVIAVPFAAGAAKRRVTGLELSGMACTVVGLAGLTMIIAGSGRSAALTAGQLAVLLAVACGVVVVLGLRGRRAGASTVWEAAAGGLAFAVCSALCQTVVVNFGASGPGFLLWPVTIFTILAIAAFAISATVLTQRSYRDGLGAPLAVTNLVNPVSATLIGIVFLGEELGASPVELTLAVLCGIVAALGVTQLARAREAEPVTV